MKTQARVKIFSFAAALYLILGGAAIKNYNQTQDYKDRLYYDYSEALMGLNDNLENLSFCLEKSLYATSPKVLNTIAGEIMHEASSAKTNLARIPLNDSAFLNVNKFLTQSGGFSYLLMQRAAEGKGVTETETNTLKALSGVASKLSLAIDEGEASYNYIDAFENLTISEGAEATLNTLLEETEEDLGGYPSLIYDGPFSDHLLEKEPQLTKTMTVITEAEAAAKAANALDLNTEELKLIGTEDGLMPCYNFEYSGGVVSVTKKGGVINYFLKTREIQSDLISYEDAVKKAEDYLKKHTEYTFKSSYYFVENGVCTVNFSYFKDDVVYYTDLIKVQVALDNGEIIGLEARGFIANHTERSFSAPSLTLSKAQEGLPKNSKIKSTALCLIPNNYGGEVLCYEFITEGAENKDIIIYINANTGKEEDILILLKTDGGSLTK